MGYNTTVVILNDALSEIAEDKKFGQKVYEAILSLPHYRGGISAGVFVTAAIAVETHHADHTSIIFVGGNTGIKIQDMKKDELVDELKPHLERLGLKIVKATVRKSKKR